MALPRPPYQWAQPRARPFPCSGRGFVASTSRAENLQASQDYLFSRTWSQGALLAEIYLLIVAWLYIEPSPHYYRDDQLVTQSIGIAGKQFTWDCYRLGHQPVISVVIWRGLNVQSGHYEWINFREYCPLWSGFTEKVVLGNLEVFCSWGGGNEAFPEHGKVALI